MEQLRRIAAVRVLGDGGAARIDLSSEDSRRIVAGVVLGLVVGKPVGVLVASWLAVQSRLAVALQGVALRPFIGAACLCGVSDTVALLMADHAFLPGPNAATSKIAVLIGSVAAAVLGTLVLVTGPKSARAAPRTASVHA